MALLLGLSGLATAAPRIGVATMQPGEIFWERFGHNALVVLDPETGDATSYNFGFFDPAEPGFVGRFVAGHMRYQLVALSLQRDLALYREEGRGVSIQWLDLEPAQAVALAAALAENARPENAHYRYDYFLDNCSTRVRDAIDRTLGGALQRQWRSRSRGLTYRSEAVRLASPAPWMWLGFDLGLGPAADRPLSRWEEAFVPMRLAAALAEIRPEGAGRNLVASEQPVLPHRIAPEPEERPVQLGRWLACGVALGLLAVRAARRRPRLTAALALPFWALGGLLGALMAFLWFGTEHRFGWANHNLLLLPPILWLLLPGAWRRLRGREGGRVFRFGLWFALALAAAALFLLWLPVQPQRNAHWIALLLPLHAGLALGFGRQLGGTSE